jgi:hypothetical protein
MCMAVELALFPGRGGLGLLSLPARLLAVLLPVISRSFLAAALECLVLVFKHRISALKLGNGHLEGGAGRIVR